MPESTRPVGAGAVAEAPPATGEKPGLFSKIGGAVAGVVDRVSFAGEVLVEFLGLDKSEWERLHDLAAKDRERTQDAAEARERRAKRQFEKKLNFQDKDGGAGGSSASAAAYGEVGDGAVAGNQSALNNI